MPVMNKSKKPGKNSEKDLQLDLFSTQRTQSSGSIIKPESDYIHPRVISFDQYKNQILIKRFYEEAEKLTRHLK